MSDDPPPRDELRSPDEEYARNYTDGYAEGVRSALREILAYAARGHTIAELRYLVQSRLAQLPDEVDHKRRILLALPRGGSAWGSPTRPLSPPRPWQGVGGTTRVIAGRTYLVREAKPRRALEMVGDAAASFRRIITISANPPTFPRVDPDHVRTFSLAATDEGPSIESLGGDVRAFLNENPETIVYFDGLEELRLHVGSAAMLRFVQWLVQESQNARGALVAVVHPQTLDPKEQAALEHFFQVLA